MRIHYFTEGRLSNFGDDLNRWLWEELAPGKWSRQSDTGFSAIGTVIRQDLLPAFARWVVFSSGVGYAPPPKDFGSPRWKVIALRGPLTCTVLGYPSSMGIIDGAALLSCVSRLKPLPESERTGIAFMPHYESLRMGNWKEVCRQCGFIFLDPHAPSEVTVEQIRRAKLVLADAMHAAIVADSLRVPWIPLMASPQINSFKWLDWTLALDLPYLPTMLPPSSVVEVIRNQTLGWYGERHAMAVPSAEDALKDYERQRRWKEKWWWPAYAKRCRQLVSGAPRKIIASRYASSWRRRSDQPHIERAAAALNLASASRSFLSRDRVLADRVDALLGRFHPLIDMPEEELFGRRQELDGDPGDIDQSRKYKPLVQVS